LIAADKAWQNNTGDPSIITAVVDTGVDLKHPDLQGQLVEGYNVIDPKDLPQDDNGHGTHVAGIIGARTNNFEGIAGVDWRSKIMPVKAMAGDGTGTVVDIADGIVWAADNGANVINLSLGEYNDSDYLHDAIKYAYDKGVVLIAAMGNDGVSDPSYPAAYPEVIGVAANDETTETAEFSNYGEHTSVSAPGVAIPSTYPNRRYVALSGTSMASPHVAGVAALIRSVNPKLSPKEVRKILEQTADDLGDTGKDEYYGYGQINVQKALQAAVNANK
jgi:subtilisin family serine protease